VVGNERAGAQARLLSAGRLLTTGGRLAAGSRKTSSELRRGRPLRRVEPERELGPNEEASPLVASWARACGRVLTLEPGHPKQAGGAEEPEMDEQVRRFGRRSGAGSGGRRVSG